MNERIRELHIQAQQQAFNEPIDIENCAVEDIKGFSQQVYEKFAELIVQECAHVAVFKDSGTVATADVAGHMAAGRSIAARLIREHFGVDE
jgi:hypothetical protein